MLNFPRLNKLHSDQTMGAHEFLATSHRTLFLYGIVSGFPDRIDPFNTNFLADYIVALNKISSDPINLVIDSDGGYVETGMILYDVMKTSKAPIHTIGRHCSSMAAILFSAGEPGHRFLYPHARLMLHLPAGSISGDAKEIEIQTKEFGKTKELLVETLMQNGAKKSHNQILKDIDREFYMNAQESIDYGIADHILSKGNLPF